LINVFLFKPSTIIRCASRFLSAIFSAPFQKSCNLFSFKKEKKRLLTKCQKAIQSFYHFLNKNQSAGFGENGVTVLYFVKKLANMHKANKATARPQVSFSIKSTERAAPNI
jgi:hypothetical protein